jgi:uncharacterized RDD family membrane protein YckC
VSRVIRNDRAVDLQGRLAGLPSRALADVIDVAIAFGIFVLIYSGLSILWDFLQSDTIEIQVQSPGLSATGMWLTLIVYLTIGWASTGRTIGKQVLGLRVVRRDAKALRPGQAFGRAVLCASFYPGLLVALFSKRNAALEDFVCNTFVLYDWIPETASRNLPPPAPPPPLSWRRRRDASREMLP